jgi:hypothetical protein
MEQSDFQAIKSICRQSDCQSMVNGIVWDESPDLVWNVDRNLQVNHISVQFCLS